MNPKKETEEFTTAGKKLVLPPEDVTAGDASIDEPVVEDIIVKLKQYSSEFKPGVYDMIHYTTHPHDPGPGVYPTELIASRDNRVRTVRVKYYNSPSTKPKYLTTDVRKLTLIPAITDPN